MRVVTWNVNGLRAALRKGFWDHVEQLQPDVLMLQEIRVTPDQLPAKDRAPEGWHVVWHPAEKKGYAGVATLSRTPIEELGRGMDGPDPQGRVLVTATGGMQHVNVYLPSGSRSDEAQQNKEAFMERFASWTRTFAHSSTPTVLGGDLNIAHTAQDIHNPKGNAKNSGFLPHERDWFGRWLDSGWSDLLREKVGEEQGPYSWWSNRGRARELDRGWRIDYLVGNRAVRCTAAFVHRAGGMEVSDHAPVVFDLELNG
jgi:exodeoxyribonuclease-3